MIFFFISVRCSRFGDGNEATDGFGAFWLNRFASGEGFKNVAKVVRSRDPAAFTEVGVGVVDAALVKCLAVSIEDDYFRGNLRTRDCFARLASGSMAKEILNLALKCGHACAEALLVET